VSRVNEKLRLLDKHLKYQWVCPSVWSGEGNFVARLKVVSKAISIVVYSNGTWKPKMKWIDTFFTEAREKEWHEWQRPLEEVEKLIQYFSQPGDLVIDPCSGGATTAVACYRLVRKFVGCDIDKAAVVKGQERLQLEQKVVPAVKAKPVPVNTVAEGDCRGLIPQVPDGSINLCPTSPPYAEQRKDEFEGSVEFAMTTGTVPWGDPGEYVHNIEGAALAFTDDDDEEEAGRITLRLVSVTEAGSIKAKTCTLSAMRTQQSWRQHTVPCSM